MARGSGIEWDDSKLAKQLRNMPKTMDRAITSIMRRRRVTSEAFAKRNAPWRDQTTNARNGLFAQNIFEKPRYAIVVAHSVPYGIWLEVRWSGRLGIISRTINDQGPQVMQDISQIFRGLGR